MLIDKATEKLLEKYKKQTIPNIGVVQTIFPSLILKVSSDGSKIILHSIPMHSISMLKQMISEITNGYQELMKKMNLEHQ